MASKLYGKRFFASFLALLVFSVAVTRVSAWSNGGYSSDVSSPKYGTHDWIAEHAKNWLPVGMRKWIDDNLNCFLYGTEFPDNSGASYGSIKGYGDTTKHHNYYDLSGAVTDASAANRAKAEFDKALLELKAGRNATATVYAGSMTHYICDVAVFAHVMTGETHHSDYEEYVETRTAKYSYGVFEVCLIFDGKLENVSAYDASVRLGRNTFDGGGGPYTAAWMDANYNWGNSAFKNRCGESLNLAANYVADVLFTLVSSAFPGMLTEDGVGLSATIDGVNWALVVTATGRFPGYPQWGTATSAGMTAFRMDTPGGASCYIARQFTVPPSSPMLSLLVWGIHDPVSVTISVNDQILETFTPPQLDYGGSPQTKQYSLANWAGQTVTIKISQTSSGSTGTYGFYKNINVSESSSISCSVSPQTIKLGNAITISGAISPAPDKTTVTLTYKKPDGTKLLRNVTASTLGVFNDTYTPDSTGMWTVSAGWPGDLRYIGSTSSPISFTVEPVPPWWLIVMILVGVLAVAARAALKRKLKKV